MNLNKKIKTITVALLLGCFALTSIACQSEGSSSDKENADNNDNKKSKLSTFEKLIVPEMLEEASDELVFMKGAVREVNNDYTVPYLNYDDLLLSEGDEDLLDERYSNTTADGEINWDMKGELTFPNETPIVDEMFLKATLNGKKISFPMKFKDLGEEYAVFDKIDFTKLDEDMSAFTITDRNTKNKIACLINLIEGYRQFDLLDKDDKFIISLIVDLKNNSICGLSTKCSAVLFTPEKVNTSVMDLRIDGIGLCSTLNEMYDKFGKPYEIRGKENILSPSIWYHRYNLNNDNERVDIHFDYSSEFYNPHTKSNVMVKPNMITGVILYRNKIIK